MKKAQPPVEAVDVKPEQTTATSKPVAKSEPRFTVAQLRPSARNLFGVSQSTYDGATASIDGEKTFTVTEMRNHIERWLKEEY